MSEYNEVLSKKIKELYLKGYKTLKEIIPFMEGADLILIDDILNSVEEDFREESSTKYLSKFQARSNTANLPLYLPAPNPLSSQWWFTLDSVEKLVNKIWSIDTTGITAFIGAPTVGFYFSKCISENIAIFDIDEDILASLDVSESVNKIHYDVYEDLDEELKKKFTSVVIDPPWYADDIKKFIQKANELIETGHIFCLIPPRLTRPDIIKERNELLKLIHESNGQVVSLESDFVKYLVPLFEQYAYKDIAIEKLDPWRGGDLLVIEVNKDTNFNFQFDKKRNKEKTYCRDPKKVRYFLRNQVSYPEQNEWFLEIDEFEKNLSSRSFNSNEFSIWNTNKKAAKAKNGLLTKKVLEAWKLGQDKSTIKNSTHIDGISKDEVCEGIEELDNIFHLWDDPNRSVRFSPDEINDTQNRYHSVFAVEESNRFNTTNYSSDGFRLEFQRDRDRVLWSNSLRKLANKCQVFPVTGDDSLRRRLTHSIEVMQLASTISVSFGLNKELTEAGALAHDIGHTPFGHAGEFALNSVLLDIAPKLDGFNHYEHGVDVVVYLEDAYKSESLGGLHGLNLTYETIECILKHTFFRSENVLSQSELIKRTKHNFIKDDSCHLEGQSIRIADKISYLISDIEDGLQMGAIGLDDLKSCSFFHRSPIDMNLVLTESLYERFVSQRRAVLKVIMEDVLNATDRKLSRIDSLEKVRELDEYIVDFSPELKKEMSEIWNKLQKNLLHKNPKVIEANLKASKVIYQLFYLFALAPELIDVHFLQNHLSLKKTDYIEFYLNKQESKNVGISKEVISSLLLDKIIGKEMTSQSANWEIPIYQIILSKDYIASMTDYKALNEYRKYINLSFD